MTVWGFRVRPPTLDRAVAAGLLKVGLMGGAEKGLFERSVERGHRVLDVGANQGLFTLLFSRLVGSEGHVFALEPEPRLFAALDDNCRRNQVDNVTRLPLAAGDRRSHGRLHRSRFNRGDNRVNDAPGPRAVPIEIAPLDELIPSDTVNFVKIDVQGYELHVLRGMQAIIDRSSSIRILFEYWPYGLTRAGSSPSDLPAFFLGRGFSLFEPFRGGLRPVDDRELARYAAAGPSSWRSVFAYREASDRGRA